MSPQDQFALLPLEFEAVRGILGEFLSGPIGSAKLAALGPSTDLERIRLALALAGEARQYAEKNARPGLAGLPHPDPLLAKLAIEGLACEGLEILSLTELARAAHDLPPAFAEYPSLGNLAAGLPDFGALLRQLEGKVLPDGGVDSSASAELGRIRRAIDRLRHEVQATLQRMLARLSRAGLVQDDLITMRNDRLVLPIRAEEKRRVEGVVHGMSASGATVYVEPLETLVLNNELVEMEDRELAEVRRILGELTGHLRTHRAELAQAAEILAEIDLAFAKAAFARSYDACLPEVSPAGGLELVEARHPVLEKTLRAQRIRPVPLTLSLAPDETVLVISGPNTGGKTVVLKTIGLAALMAQSGLPVPALSARLPLFGRVMADIGDQQSIEASLSTFSAHVANLRRMAEAAGAGDLILADELGGSTDPAEGGALAVALLEHFRGRGARAVVTTHHSRLKAFAAETPGAVNAAMEFDDRTLESTYRLLMGLPGKSSGLAVAERLGLSREIVDRARALIDPEEREMAALVESLHRERTELDEEKRESERERRELEARRREIEGRYENERRARLEDLSRRFEQALKRESRRWETVIADLRAELRAQAARTAAAGAGGSKSQLRKLEHKLESLPVSIAQEARAEWQHEAAEAAGLPESQPEPELLSDAPPAVGDTVKVEGMPGSGKVVATSAESVEVEVGRLRMRLRPDQVRVVVRRPNPASSASAAAGPWRAPAAELASSSDEPDSAGVNVAPEINVIGRTAEEARERVDEYLDQAFVGRRRRLRIIHGHGKGILRRTLHEMFASHPHVERYYPAEPSEGGTGATIVELRL